MWSALVPGGLGIWELFVCYNSLSEYHQTVSCMRIVSSLKCVFCKGYPNLLAATTAAGAHDFVKLLCFQLPGTHRKQCVRLDCPQKHSQSCFCRLECTNGG